MKKQLILIAAAMLLFSCSQGTRSGNPSNFKPDYSSPESVIKSYFEYSLTNEEMPVFIAKDKFQREHKDEILKTFSVAEKIEIPKTGLTLVFISYSIGSDIVRDAFYVRKVGSDWLVENKYYSSYDADPFKNGNGAAGKALIDKKEKWAAGSSDTWWK